MAPYGLKRGAACIGAYAEERLRGYCAAAPGAWPNVTDVVTDLVISLAAFNHPGRRRWWLWLRGGAPLTDLPQCVAADRRWHCGRGYPPC